MWQRKFAFAVIAIALLFTVSGTAYTPATAEEDSVIGKTAPDFTLKNLSGKDVKLSNASKDKVTILTFWVTWCPHCQREMPVLQKVYSDLSKKGFTVVAVGLDDPDDVKEFSKENKLSYPVLIGGNDGGAAVAELYEVSGVPHMVFIDKTGKVKSVVTGERDEAEVRAELAKLGLK